MRVGTSSRKLIGETTRLARARDEEGRCVIAFTPPTISCFAETQDTLFRQRHQLDGLFFVTSIEFFCLRMQVLSLVFFVLKEVQAPETKQKHKANALLHMPFLCK